MTCFEIIFMTHAISSKYSGRVFTKKNSSSSRRYVSKKKKKFAEILKLASRFPLGYGGCVPVKVTMSLSYSVRGQK